MKRKISCSCQELNPSSSVIQPLAWSLHQLSYPGSTCYQLLIAQGIWVTAISSTTIDHCITYLPLEMSKVEVIKTVL
jgi:hypothetical protein